MSGVPPARHTAPAPDWRLRRMRVARGACWVIVAAVLAAAALVLLDAAARLPGWFRGLGLAVWLTAVGVLAWRLVVRPMRDEPTPGEADPAPAQELPGNATAAAAAALSLAVCLLAGTLVPGAGEHIRRVALPWQKPAASPYRVVVTSGDTVVRRGGAVTLTAYAEKTDPAAAPAGRAVFVIRTRNPNREVQLVMPADAGGAFHITRPRVIGDFEYCVEIEGVRSEWYTVAALDPAEPTAESVTEILPPRYIGAASVRRTTAGFAPIDGFQHGSAEFRFRFSRPASSAFLEFRPDDGPKELSEVPLSEDGHSGTTAMRLKRNGTLYLVAHIEQNGKRLRSESVVGVRVRTDGPPRFDSIGGVSPRPVTVRPGTPVRIEVNAVDDLAVAGVVLEYVPPGESKPVPVAVPLTGTGTAAASGRLDFDLTGKLRDGQTLRFRLRVFDSRKLDDPELKPQEAVYPEGEWGTIRLDAAAPPLEQQVILGRRDALRDTLTTAQQELRAAAEDADKLLTDTAGKATLAPDHVGRLNDDRDTGHKAAGLLHDAAREAALNPELRSLAAAIRSTADTYLRNADEALRKAATDPIADRPLSLASAGKSLSDAADRIDELLARNDRLARDRLDYRALAALAAELDALAVKASDTPPAELLRKQQDILARFRQLLAESEPLNTALDGAKQQEFNRLATATADLAGLVNGLNSASRALHADTRARLLETLALDEKRIATRTAVLLDRIETAARLANVALPKAAEFRQVADLIATGRTIDALTELEALAGKLEAVALPFEKWAADRVDSKVAARQLALWQDDLRTRFLTAAGGKAANFGALPAATRTAFRTEQAAIRAAAAALRVAPGDVPKAAYDTALEHLTLSGTFLNGTGAQADVSMKNSVDHLNRLAEKLPSIADRFGRARGEFNRLDRDQTAIGGDIEKTYRNTDAGGLAGRLTKFAPRQRDQIAAFAALDLPGLELRRSRITAALAAATFDLSNGVTHDIPASQAWVRREFDALRMILGNGGKPADDRLDELSRRMEATTRAVEALLGPLPTVPAFGWPALSAVAECLGPAPSPRQLEPHGAVVQDVARQLAQVFPRSPPEGAALLFDSQEALSAAEIAFRAGAWPAELLRRLRAASAAVGNLSDRLNGAESDQERVRRLAANRRAWAEIARANEGRKASANPGLPGEISRQLVREHEELAHTRVGVAGQLLKKRSLDLYTRLKDNPSPDRQAGAHAALAETLEELAAVMADIDELTATFDRRAPAAAATEADDYLPSRLLADALRDLARQHRAIRSRITEVPGDLLARVKPAAMNPIPDLEKRQRRLAADIATFAQRLHAEKGRPPAGLADDATEAATRAADHIRNGAIGSAVDDCHRAGELLAKLAANRGAPWSDGANTLMETQDALELEIGKLLYAPAAAAAQQQARSAELVAQVNELVRSFELAAQDVAADETAGKALTDAAKSATAAGKLLADAAPKAAAGQADDAATLRTEAESHLRAAGAKAAGAGAVLTMLPGLDPDATAIGAALQEAEKSLRRAARSLEGKPDATEAGKALRSAAEALDRAAKAVRNRRQGP